MDRPLASSDRSSDPGTPLAPALEGAYALGRGEARSGRTMDALLAAYRVGARVSWRELSATAVEAGLTKLLTIHPEYASAVSHDTGGIPDVSDMPAPIRAIFESAFGDATGHIFLVALPFAVGALIAVLFIKEVPLRTSVKREDELVAEAAQA